jgi:hypothetical protein
MSRRNPIWEIASSTRAAVAAVDYKNLKLAANIDG